MIEKHLPKYLEQNGEASSTIFCITALFQNWKESGKALRRSDSSDSGFEAGSQNDSDYNPEIRSEPPRAIRRVTRSRRAVVVLENQEVEPTIDDLHHMSSTALSERNISEY
ncbi:hypothetical protein G6F56_012641 [Rhizopus delemar]|nr:hypothetical protein G6F56_012641 [Rhizopus delemar]